MKKQMPDHANCCAGGPFQEKDSKTGCNCNNSKRCGNTGGPFLEPAGEGGRPFLEGDGRCSGSSGGPFLEPGADTGAI